MRQVVAVDQVEELLLQVDTGRVECPDDATTVQHRDPVGNTGQLVEMMTGNEHCGVPGGVSLEEAPDEDHTCGVE